jgi:hypothetical protein
MHKLLPAALHSVRIRHKSRGRYYFSTKLLETISRFLQKEALPSENRHARRMNNDCIA